MTYQPNAQDELIAEAEDIGGVAFVEMIQIGARIEAAEAVSWDGEGKEPPEFREAWLRAARGMVEARWSLLHGED